MNLIDIAIGAILLIAFYLGFKRGFFVTIASLIGLVAGILGAIYFSDFTAVQLHQRFDWDPQMVNIAAFAITFLAIVIAIALLGKILTQLADFTMLGWANKLLGGVFNLVKYALILSVVFVLVESTGKYQILGPEDRQESVLYGPVSGFVPAILPDLLRQTRELREELMEDPPLQE